MNAPPKPYPDFPLFAAKNGQWRKDVRVNGGKPQPFYFGAWATDPEGKAAVKEWMARQDGIRAGLDHMRVQATGTALTLADLLKRFLAHKQAEYTANRLSAETFRDYIRESNALAAWAGTDAQVAAFTPDHFAAYRKHMETTRGLGVDRLATNIRMLRAVFNHGAKMGWCPRPNYGVGFDPPATDSDSKAAAKLRKGEDAEELPVWSGPQVEWLLAHAGPVMQAAVLVALNCGMGPSDLARLKWRNVKGNRLALRRGKTGTPRECYLWKRTRAALDALRSLPHQSAAILKDGDGALVFLNKAGLPIVSRTDCPDAKDAGKIRTVRVSASFSAGFVALVKRARAAGIVPAKGKLTFYNFRHTFYTHAENTGDLNALHRATGHTLAGQGRRYKRGRFPLARLKRLALAVKRGVWPRPKAPKGGSDAVTPGKLRIAG